MDASARGQGSGAERVRAGPLLSAGSALTALLLISTLSTSEHLTKL